METALIEARKALDEEEIPIGAAAIFNGELIAKAHNQTISLNDPTAHAEILAIRESAKKLNNYRLNGVYIYSTIEPCIMCLMAMVHARISLLTYACEEPRWGGIEILKSLWAKRLLNHEFGIIKVKNFDESRIILQGFFNEKRKKSRTHLKACKTSVKL